MKPTSLIEKRNGFRLSRNYFMSEFAMSLGVVRNTVSVGRRQDREDEGEGEEEHGVYATMIPVFGINECVLILKDGER
jgi:hypothetical protein